MKRIASLTLVLLIVVGFQFALAGDEKEHTEDIAEVLGISKSKEVKALGKAVALTIDQGGIGQYNWLVNYGVNDLPSFEEIHISAVGEHRYYSHLGWDSKYRKDDSIINDSEWQKKWEKRKSVLKKTVEKVLGVMWWQKIPILNLTTETNNDSFCALLYYVHLLGDHCETEGLDEYNQMMQVGGSMMNLDIISELMYHIEVLLQDQEGDFSYIHLMNVLDEYERKYFFMGRNNESNIATNKEYAKEILDTLKSDIPKLLKKESFFIDMQKKAS